ncbi:DUF2474 domain-containing protein [Vibrio fluvialis]|nr:DUF2474 domain-containing protein [Vibrio fluvialis]AVH32702.1 DUF2474 domain-containing protein [Vibrio fluvialis]MBL4241160.1 DUF2474 domain-containing protein [Vibrio fluvialis]MBL4250111.1 DUF2474 domain-containing protein [Vibrio fluvialis]MBY7787156.1 DUF2474 domain-containing protein [Vibrio fluvialis]MBY8113969.1 DUF2474 domain-containing protein [Vibrio fluvialis]
MSRPQQASETPAIWKQWLWLAGIWCVSVATLGIVATLFRALMTAAGLRA